MGGVRHWIRWVIAASILAIGPLAESGVVRAVGLQFALAGQLGGDLIEPPSAYLVGGAFNRRDFQGEGTSISVAGRVRLPLGSRFILEPGLEFAAFESDSIGEGVGRDARLLILDFQLQYQFSTSALRPYVGAGTGGAVDFRDERVTLDFLVSTFTFSAGTTLNLGSDLTGIGELRYRTLDEFKNRVLGIYLGLGWRL